MTLRKLLISVIILISTINIVCCSSNSYKKFSALSDVAIVVDEVNKVEGSRLRENCDRYACFSTLKCDITPSTELLYYVYPPLAFLDKHGHTIYSTNDMITYEYWKILKYILTSHRLTLNPERACYFVPSVDLAWLATFNSTSMAAIYDKLPFWRYVDGLPGTNHLIIDLGSRTNVRRIQSSIGRAILVSSGFDTWTLRPDFDHSIPLLDIRSSEPDSDITRTPGRWKLLSTQYNSLSDRQRHLLVNLENSTATDLLIVGYECDNNVTDGIRKARCMANDGSIDDFDKTTCRCTRENTEEYSLPYLLSSSLFCLILNPGQKAPLGDSVAYLLAQSMRYGCVPIVSSNIILPFQTDLSWEEMSVSIVNEEDLERLVAWISAISPARYERMSGRCRSSWVEMFETPEKVAGSILTHYDSFVYPHKSLESRCHAGA